ncbi:MAG: methyltransferase [Acidimicrobiia bacterium]|jgi:16S rRNA (guanine1207-N2)-methyltransferase|nr:methyltransferase [Acidimicrobiia bacterium]
MSERGGDGHYFAAHPTAASRPGEVQLVLPDLQLRLATDAGVFAGAAIDPGTKLLLLDGPRPDAAGTGSLLDLGCGYGPIALALASRAPAATVWALDVNERARGLCAANAEAACLANVVVAAPDDVPDDVVFAGIWSNPPIRIGKPALHELLARWLARLAPEGHAALVVAKHLGSDSLASWLTRQGWHATRLSSRAGYRLLDVAAAER